MIGVSVRTAKWSLSRAAGCIPLSSIEKISVNEHAELLCGGLRKTSLSCVAFLHRSLAHSLLLFSRSSQSPAQAERMIHTESLAEHDLREKCDLDSL